MKKKSAVILTIVLLGLTACSDSNSSQRYLSNTSSEIFESNNNSEVSDIESKPANATNTSSSSINSTSENNSEKSDASNESSTAPAQNEFAAPDGSTLSVDEAVAKIGVLLVFDHSYIRYAQPIFYNTVDDPTLVNWETLEFNIEESSIKNPGYFKVKAGDKLENGLTIKSAEYEIYPSGRIVQNMIEFEGEITLEGILHCQPEDDIGTLNGRLDFWVDTTKCKFVPLTCGSYSETDTTVLRLNAADKTAFVSDGDKIIVGDIYSTGPDLSGLSGVITPGECIKAKVTIKDLSKFWSDGNGSISYAELVSVEELPE